MLRWDYISMEICGNFAKKRTFSRNFGWSIIKIWASRSLSRSWLNYWENFIEISGKLSGKNIAKF